MSIHAFPTPDVPSLKDRVTDARARDFQATVRRIDALDPACRN